MSAGAAETVAFEGELLALARRCALAAGAELSSRWRGPLEVSTKSTPTDPVSEADVAAETAIREILGRERPGDAILGEEGGQTDGAPEPGASSAGLRWVVDPLDGTVNYLYGLPAFVVSVAVEDADGGLAAVTHDPVRGDLYMATRSGPVVRERADGTVEPLRGTACERLDRALLATGFAYDPDLRAAQGRVVAEVLPRVRDIRRAGAAALDMAWLAAGHVDAYYERGVKPWDIGSGTLLCARAGLVIRELPEAVDPQTGMTLAPGILAAPAAFADELYALVAAG